MFKWPWTEIHSKIKIFGFGSLIDRHSLRQSAPGADIVLAYTKGYRRIFNYQTVTPGTVLNVEPSEDTTINGVVFELPSYCLRGFAIRELGYDLVPIEAFDWKTNESLGTAHLCCCTNKRLLKNNHPDYSYLEFVISACKRVDKEYLEMFLGTTFLADGKTALKQVVKL